MTLTGSESTVHLHQFWFTEGVWACGLFMFMPPLLAPDDMPLKGALLREAAVNLFESVAVKMCAR
jgi:hypothetical protein